MVCYQKVCVCYSLNQCKYKQNIAFGIVYTIIFNLIKEIMSSKSLIKYMQIKQKNDYE